MSSRPATHAAESQLSTTGDTDLAADCAGVLDFVNQASLATLDAALPSREAGEDRHLLAHARIDEPELAEPLARLVARQA